MPWGPQPGSAGDVIDLIVGQWARERPDLDVSPTHVLQRLTRLHLLQSSSFAEVFARHGLTFGEWEVLAALRRSGPPYRMRPSDLNRAVVLSSGAMTNRLDRLEESGLVERSDDPVDRRVTLVSLTAAGREVCDRAQLDHLANENRLLGGLDPDERAALVGLLRKLLLSPAFRALDPHPGGTRPDGPGRRAR